MNENEVLATFGNYTMHRRKNSIAGSYYLCIPNGEVYNYHMYIGFASKDFSSLTKEEIVAEVDKVANFVFSLNGSGVFILPDIPIAQLEQAAFENDDRMFNDILVSKIHPITKEVAVLLSSRHAPLINMIKRSEYDRKLVGWIAMKYGDKFIEEINFDDDLSIMYNKNVGQLTAATGTQMENQMSEHAGTNAQVSQFSSGIAPINREYENVSIQGKQNDLERRLTKPKNTSPGFSNINFIIMTLIVSLVVGVSVGFLLMK